MPPALTVVITSVLMLLSGSPPAGQVGVPYSFQFQPVGGTPPYKYSGTPADYEGHFLPNGMTLSPTGLLSGTPIDGSYCNISITDSNPTVKQTLTVPFAVPPTVAITYSADEKIVKLQYNRFVMTIPRPVVVPWSFTPTGVTYWMSPTGVDTNDGLTQATSWATAQHFANIAKPGDCLYVMPGFYRQAVYVPYTSGTATAPITISCAPVAQGGGLGTVTFAIPQDNVINGNRWPNSPTGTAPPNIETSVFDLHAANYWIVNGLNFQGAQGEIWAPNNNTSYGNPNGLLLENGNCLGCVIQNCFSYRNLHCGYKDQSGLTNGVKFLGCIAMHNGETSLDHGLYMPGNNCVVDGFLAINNAGYGLHFYSGPINPTVTRSVAWNNGTGGFAFYTPVGGSVYNNISYGTGVTTAQLQYKAGVSDRGFALGGNCKGVKFRNNIAFNHYYDVDFSSSLGNDWDYCDVGKYFYASGVINPATGVGYGPSPGQPGSHCLSTLPIFLSGPIGNFQMVPNNPTNQPMLTQGIDMGLGLGTRMGPY